VSPKTSTFYFLNNCQKLTDFNDFWHVKWRENLTRKPYRLSTSPVRRSHCTLGNRKVIFNSIIHTHCRLFTLSHQKTICNTLPTTPENITTLTCKMRNFFIWLLRSFRRWRLWQSQLWVVVGGSEKNRLWWVATRMSGKQCHSLFRHRSVARCAEIQPTSQQATAASLSVSVLLRSVQATTCII